jgi:hypothetical protein
MKLSGAMPRSRAERSSPPTGSSSGQQHSRCRRLIQCCTTSRVPGAISMIWRSMSSACAWAWTALGTRAMCFSAVTL